MHFVLHSAFCGPTLLARYLEQLPHCLVIKEPGLLGQLSGLKSHPSEPEHPAWSDWFAASMALLARGYPSDIAVVVKAPDLCNWMGDLLLDQDRATKIVFLHCPLRIFLLQVLKAAHRREWLRDHVRQLSHLFAQVPFLSGVSVPALSDGQRAVVMWLLNSFLCRRLLSRKDADRVLVVNGEELIDEPSRVLQTVAAFFAVASDPANRSALASFQPISHHAKDPGMPYDAETRFRELQDTQLRCGDEVAAAIAWAKDLSADWISSSPFPIGE